MQEEKDENDSSAFDELGRLGEEMEFLSEGDISATERKRKAKNTVKQRPEKQRIQYSTRGKKYSYCEAEVPDDDHYICKLNHEFYPYNREKLTQLTAIKQTTTDVEQQVYRNRFFYFPF